MKNMQDSLMGVDQTWSLEIPFGSSQPSYAFIEQVAIHMVEAAIYNHPKTGLFTQTGPKIKPWTQTSVGYWEN